MNTQLKQIEIFGLDENIAYSEAIGLSKCFAAYATLNEDIMEGGIGFNPNSGYVYIALENGISICSMLGNDVEYMVTNHNDGEELFFDTYDEAINYDVYEE